MQKICKWNPYIKEALDRRGNVRDIVEFRSGIQTYLQDISSSSKRSVNDFDELLLLLKFISDMNFRFFRVNFDNPIVTILSNIRNIDRNEKRSEFDSKIIHFLKVYSKREFIIELLKSYYINEDDIEEIINFLHHMKNNEEYVHIVLDNFSKSHVVEDAIEQFCIAFQKNIEAKDWLVEYYKHTEQYEKAIDLLTSIIVDEQKNEDNILYAQTQLVWFYGKVGRNTSRNELVTMLLKNRKSDKQKMFIYLKETMSKKEWYMEGKELLKGWANGKSSTTCLSVFAATDAIDLLIEHIISNGVTMDMLNRYFALLCNYDEGVTYTLYKQILKQEIEGDLHFVSWALHDFYNYYPKTQNSMYALKIMIVQLEEEFKNNSKLVNELEIFEEKLYEN